MVFSGGRLGDWGYCAKQQDPPSGPSLQQAFEAYRRGNRRLLVNSCAGLSPLESDDACDLFEPVAGPAVAEG
jgi:hypothetical protein